MINGFNHIITKNNGSCVSTKQIPVCENAALCEFSGDINGDWLLTVNAASDRAGETKNRFFENVNVDIFVNGSCGASATIDWAAGKDGEDGVLLIRNQRF